MPNRFSVPFAFRAAAAVIFAICILQLAAGYLVRATRGDYGDTINSLARQRMLSVRISVSVENLAKSAGADRAEIRKALEAEIREIEAGRRRLKEWLESDTLLGVNGAATRTHIYDEPDALDPKMREFLEAARRVLLDVTEGRKPRDEDMARLSVESADDLVKSLDEAVDHLSSDIENWQNRASLIRDVFGLLVLVGALGLGHYMLRPAVAAVEEARRASEEALGRERAVNARLKATQDAAMDAMIVIDRQGIIQSLSAAGLRIFGYEADEIVGRNISLLMPEPDRSNHDDHIRKYLGGGQRNVIGRRREVIALRKNGEEFPAELSVAEVNEGGVRYFVGTIADISSRKEAQAATAAALGEAEAMRSRLLDAIETMSAGIAIYDSQERIVVWNEKFREMFPRGFLGAQPGDFYRDLMAKVSRQDLDLEGEDIESWRFRRLDFRRAPTPEGFSFKTKAGRHLRIFDHSMRDGGRTTLVSDVSEAVAREEELTRRNRALRALTDCDSALLVATDERELLQRVVEILVDEAGYRFAWVGEKGAMPFCKVDPVAHAGDIGGYLEHSDIRWSADGPNGMGPMGTALRENRIVVIGDTETESSFAPWRDLARQSGFRSVMAMPFLSGGKSFAAIALYGAERNTFGKEEVAFLNELAVKVTLGIRTLRLQAEREEARAQAETANRAKSEFLSNMSHELRTPLNAILGFAQLLDFNPKEPLTEKQKNCVHRILAGGNHLLDLINDVLDMAKIEAGKIKLSIEPVSVDEVLAACLSLVQGIAEKKRIKLEAPPPCAIKVLADYTRFRQVLVNLLSNAVKYNREGGWVRINLAPDSHGLFRIEVADGGMGIAEAYHADLFKPFSRAGAESSGIEGTGIGLALSRQLVEMMRGEIGFSSVVGEGSRFWFKLPLLAAQDTLAVDEILNPGALTLPGVSGTLLYVEDNPANLELMEMIVERMEGLTMISATNAERGIELARQHRPDLTILDINLPGMNGYEALVQLRAIPDLSAMPVIALTAGVSRGDAARGLGAGFFRFLTKPVKVKELADAIVDARAAAGKMMEKT